MAQKAIRTTRGSNMGLNDYFNKGWFLVIVTPIGEELEYIIQNNNP